MQVIDINGLDNCTSLFGQNKYEVSQSNLTFPYEKGYIKSSDVYAIVSRIARNGRMIPWVLTKTIGDKSDIVTEGELFDRIQTPNPTQNNSEFVEMAITQLLLSGEIYLNNIQSVGSPKGIGTELLNPQILDVKTAFTELRNNIVEYVYNIGGEQAIIEPEFVTQLLLPNPTKDGIESMRGLSPLVAGYLTLVGLTNNQTANASILENQGASGILSNESDNVLTPTQRKEAQSTLDKLIAGVRNFGKIIQGTTKLKFLRLGLDPTQLKIIESKLLKFRDLCSIYNVDSILFNDPASSTFENRVISQKAFYTDAVIPNTQLIVDAFSKSVLPLYNKGQRGTFAIELDISGVESLQADQRVEAEKDKTNMEGVNIILNMPVSQEAKASLLVSQYGFSEEDAQLISTTNDTTDV